ncbi:MAG: hypothetical protein H7838_05470 [Magnetococcus sp. DMHC-8]
MTITSTTCQVLFQCDWLGRTMVVVDEGEYRSLYFDNHMTQSRMSLAHPLWLVLPYTRHMLACLLFNNHPRHIFMIGLGGGSLAKFFLYHFPACRLEVVDANPVMATVARQFFFLPVDDRLTLHCADGEAFVTARAGQPPLYDLILVDAFDHDGMSPTVYASRLFLKMYPLLTDHGILAFNVNRAEADLYPHIIAHIGDCFPDAIFRLPVAAPSHNEIILCCKQSRPAGDLAALQRHVTAWEELQPDLDFIDFQQRMVPLKQTAWHQWLDRLTSARGRSMLS